MLYCSLGGIFLKYEREEIYKNRPIDFVFQQEYWEENASAKNINVVSGI